MTVTPEEMRAAAVMGARLAGCDCSPDIAVVEEPDMPGIYRANIAHDDWCRLLRRMN